MPFVIHGRDPRTGEWADPFYSNAATEELARAEATTQGLVIEAVEPRDDPTLSATTPSAAAVGYGHGQYEFGPEHNMVIGGLASTMNICGVVAMIFGILQAINVMYAPRELMPAPLVPAVLGIIFGGLLLYAAEAFRRIVRTQGRDIDHLMDALGRLRFTFGLMLFIAVLAIVAAIAVMVTNRL